MPSSPVGIAGRAALAAGVVGAGCVAYGHFWELNDFRLRRFDVPVLPPDTAPLRVLHLSDLHLLAGQRRKQRWVSRLSGLEPDLVVSTGDTIAFPEALAYVEGTLGRLLDRPGVFVFGSNDYWRPNLKNPLEYLIKGPSTLEEHGRDRLPTEDLRGLFLDHGWLDLNNAAARLDLMGHRVEVRGTDDAHIDRDDWSAVAGPADSEADLHLGVTHAPYVRVLDAMTADGMDLILAGHTHGGQVCLPGVGALVTNCDIDPARVKGLSQHSSGGRTAALHVSAGLGTSPYAPYRFFCRPEATLLTLLPRE